MPQLAYFIGRFLSTFLLSWLVCAVVLGAITSIPIDGVLKITGTVSAVWAFFFVWSDMTPPPAV